MCADLNLNIPKEELTEMVAKADPEGKGTVDLQGYFLFLTHLSLASHKKDIGKQCKPRSDAAERGVWSGSTLFALNSEIPTKQNIIMIKTNQTPLI